MHLLPGSRAKAAKAMEELLYRDFVPVTSPRLRPVARQMARHRLANENKEPLISTSVGRPGLDPGTLGVKRSFFLHSTLPSRSDPVSSVRLWQSNNSEPKADLSEVVGGAC